MWQIWLVWAIVLTVSVVTIGPVVWNHFKAKGLEARGVSMRAVIEAMEDTGSRVNTNPVIRVQLKVMPASGPAYPAETTLPLTALQLTRLSPGSEVNVKVDPENPQSLLLKPDP